MASPRVLVDADGLLYLAGFGVQKTNYQVIVEDAAGELDYVWFPSAAEIREFFKENPDLSEVETYRHPEVGPVEHAIQIAKSKMTEIETLYPGAMEVYIRGDNQVNFRDRIATLHPYKGNRSSEKPEHFEAIRQYLVDYWRAYKIDEHEVDDEIGCRLTELAALGEEAVIVSPDKDLNQLPGHHYSYKTNSSYDVDPIEAQQFFWQQCLSGDYADNIHGAWKVGAAKAADIMCAINHLDEEEIWQSIINVYAESMEKPSCPYAGEDPEAVALENAQLVYMRRYRGEIWQPPGIQNTVEEVRSLDSAAPWETHLGTQGQEA